METTERTDDLTQEQLDKLGFIPTEAELAQVDRMSTSIVRDLDNKRRFMGQRNRDSWKRMNRPTKTQAIDKGADMINRLVTKGLALNSMTGP